MLEQALAWLTVVTGASIMYMAGRPRFRRAAWYLGVANQFVWGSFAVLTRTWGLLAGCLLYGGTYIRHIVRGDR